MKPDLPFKDVKKSFAKTIGKTIMTYRQNSQLTQQQLADLVDLSVQQIQKYEYGETNISVVRLLNIAKALDMNLLELLQPALEDQYKTNCVCQTCFQVHLDSPLDLELLQRVKKLDPKKKETLLDFLPN